MSRTLTARDLAGDTRAGDWTRQQAWREQRAFLRLRWMWLVPLWLTMASPTLLVWSFFPPFLRGVVLGGSVVGATAAVWSLVVQMTGTATRTMGAEAEQWTAQEIRRLQRRGWRIVNHLELGRDGDTDHVLVGPAGVVVLETKWSSRSWLVPSVAERTINARRQVSRNALRVQNWSKGWTGRAPVRPVVVLWGGGLRRDTGGVMACPDEGVTVLAGQRLRAWLEALPVDPAFDAATVDRVWEGIVTHVRKRDQHEQAKSPRLLTPSQWVQRVWFAAAAVAVGLFALLIALDALF